MRSSITGRIAKKSIVHKASKNVLFSAGQDHLWSPSQKRPHTKWEAKVDQLLRKNLASQHYETRKPLLDEILIILSENLPQIPLVVEYLAAAADVLLVEERRGCCRRA